MILRLNRCIPNLRDGSEDITGIRDYNELPAALKKYVEFIEKETGVPVTMVSVGPDREETIFRN